jgi:hypothetical protein
MDMAPLFGVNSLVMRGNLPGAVSSENWSMISCFRKVVKVVPEENFRLARGDILQTFYPLLVDTAAGQPRPMRRLCASLMSQRLLVD